MKKEKEIIPQKTISPSSINTYFKCPRSYYYQYLLKIKVKPSIHLVKGIVVHKVFEDFFKGYKDNLKEHLFNILEKTWEKNDYQLKDLELSPEELKKEKEDCINIINEYWETSSRKMNSLVHSGKAENLQHAYFLIKPKFKELYVKDEKLNCCGFIDRIHENYDGKVTLGDYKTSSKYGVGILDDHKRQLAIYSLLYKNQEKKQADYVSVIFLRYGEEYLLEVTPSLLRFARETIEQTYKNTRSVTLADYPKKEGSLCRWCSYQDICSGKEECEEKQRISKLKKIIKKSDNGVEIWN